MPGTPVSALYRQERNSLRESRRYKSWCYMEETNNRPAGAILLSSVGGLLVLVSGISIMMIGTFLSSISLVPGLTAGAIIIAASVWGIICGLVMLIGSYLIRTRPRTTHTLWGILIFVFGLSSYFGGGGFFIGGILGIAGGLMAVRWDPDKVLHNPEEYT
ncbi:MAG TPA: hypothetical protein VMS89_05605 [Methanoregulaceae archaeon]|nr:hypothetical protein [Methanoregulaceae archaeon]